MEQTVSYQLSRKEVIRFLYSRFLRRGRIIRLGVILLAIGGLCFYSGAGSLGNACVVFLLFFLGFYYFNLGRMVGRNPGLTAARTITFGPAGIVSSMSDGKSEVAWSMFRSFSENATYFILQRSDYQMEAIIPKAAFTAEQQEGFRRYGEGIKIQGKSAK